MNQIKKNLLNPITIRLDDDDLEQVERLARQGKVSRTIFLRQVVRDRVRSAKANPK